MNYWAFLVVQWLKIRLPTQGAWVQPLVRDDSTRCGATKPTTTATKPRAGAPQEKTPRREARAPQLEKAYAQQQRTQHSQKYILIKKKIKNKASYFIWKLWWQEPCAVTTGTTSGLGPSAWLSVSYLDEPRRVGGWSALCTANSISLPSSASKGREKLLTSHRICGHCFKTTSLQCVKECVWWKAKPESQLSATLGFKALFYKTGNMLQSKAPSRRLE